MHFIETSELQVGPKRTRHCGGKGKRKTRRAWHSHDCPFAYFLAKQTVSFTWFLVPYYGKFRGPSQWLGTPAFRIVTRAAPADLARMTVTEFMGMSPPDPKARNTVEDRTYRQASPFPHVSPESAPILLIHGDADKSVPFEQSEMMEKALRAAGVPTKLLRIPGGGHGPTFPGAINPPDYMGEMIKWLDHY